MRRSNTTASQRNPAVRTPPGIWGLRRRLCPRNAAQPYSSHSPIKRIYVVLQLDGRDRTVGIMCVIYHSYHCYCCHYYCCSPTFKIFSSYRWEYIAAARRTKKKTWWNGGADAYYLLPLLLLLILPLFPDLQKWQFTSINKYCVAARGKIH